MRKAPLTAALGLGVTLALTHASSTHAGQDSRSGNPVAARSKQLGHFLSTYCADCHSGDDAEGGLAIESLTGTDLQADARSRWQQVSRQIRFNAMPPADYDPRPPAAERAAALEWIDQLLTDAVGSSDQPPRHATLRRLNRAEYDNTLRDLLGVDFKPSRIVGLPDDNVGNGFDNQGEVLSFSPLLMEKYLDAAEEVTRRVIIEQPSELIERTLLANPPVGTRRQRDAIREIITRFLPRAYRRPVDANEIEQLVALGAAELHAGGSYPEAIATSVGATLVSPNFLFRPEPAAGARLNGYELASRLSYFLWSSMPDKALFEAAGAGDLDDPAALRGQVARMMADPRAESLAERFFAQWLGLHRLEHAAPTRRLFRKWNTKLQLAMREETLSLVRHVVREDLGLFELFDARYTFVNPRLAELYGVSFDGEDPRELYLRGPGRPESARRQPSEDRHGQYDREDEWLKITSPRMRRGLLTHASVLTLTSNPQRTSPVKRGHWVLETVLGDAPPPAPPDVPELEETAAEEPHLTLSEQLAMHRSDPACAGCHQQMDPIGIAFENFDSIGAWRVELDGAPIDASAELEGRSFNGAEELIDLVRAREGTIARHFTSRLLVYALGRGLTRQDDGSIDAITAAAKDYGYRLSVFLQAIVTSPAFLSRGAEEGNHPEPTPLKRPLRAADETSPR